MVIVIVLVLLLIAVLVAVGLVVGTGSRQLRKGGFDEQTHAPAPPPRA
jgi:hypothetical protein